MSEICLGNDDFACRFRGQDSGSRDGAASQKHQIHLFTMQARDRDDTMRFSVRAKSDHLRLEPSKVNA